MSVTRRGAARSYGNVDLGALLDANAGAVHPSDRRAEARGARNVRLRGHKLATRTSRRSRTKKKAVRRRPFPEQFWWTAGGSNSRPPRCERGALPAELAAHGLDGSSAAHTLRARESCDRKLPILTCPFPARQCDRERTGRRVHAAGWPRCRKYSTRMGSSETKTMPRATSVKFSCTTGTLPKAYPASVQMPTQMIPPVML
jgi:hypothetical protein